MKKFGLIFSVLCIALGLTACPGKDKGGSAARTPTNDCAYNSAYGTWTSSNGQACTPTNPYNTNYCYHYRYNPANDRYVDNTGQVVNCQNSYIDFNNRSTLPYYTMNSSGAVNGCQGWSSMYGGTYYPVYLGTSLVCMRSSYITSYYPNFYYYPGYYPRTCVTGVNCRSSCSGYAAGGAFAGLWLGGTLSLCY